MNKDEKDPYSGQGSNFKALLKHMGNEDTRDFVEWGFWTGMKASDITKLTWKMFDPETGGVRGDDGDSGFWTLKLPATATTKPEQVLVILTGPLKAIIERRLKARRPGSQRIFNASPHSVHSLRYFHDLLRPGVDLVVICEAAKSRKSKTRVRRTFVLHNGVTKDELHSADRKVSAYVESLVFGRNGGGK